MYEMNVTKCNEQIRLVLPTYTYMEQLRQFKKILLKSHSPYHGTGAIEKHPIDKWIQRCEDHRQGINLPSGFVPATLFMAIREKDNRVVGLIQIRHTLNENLLRVGGNIGYMTIEDERLKGYATEMLRLCLLECKKLGLNRVLITCNKWNVGSSKTIIANGGVLENEIVHEGEVMRRYWINI